MGPPVLRDVIYLLLTGSVDVPRHSNLSSLFYCFPRAVSLGFGARKDLYLISRMSSFERALFL